MGIRRQIKINNQSISLARLLKEIVDTPEVITRKRYVSLYKNSTVEFKADADFDEFAGEGKDHIDPEMVKHDLTELQNQGIKIEEFADKRIAHTDKAKPKYVPVFEDIDSCIFILGELLKKYLLVFKAEALMEVLPVYQYEWKEIFREPWLVE